jgi:hypothetical protein
MPLGNILLSYTLVGVWAIEIPCAFSGSNKMQIANEMARVNNTASGVLAEGDYADYHPVQEKRRHVS